MTAVREPKPLAPLDQALVDIEEIAGELDAQHAHACAGWDCATCTPSNKAERLRETLDVLRREIHHD